MLINLYQPMERSGTNEALNPDFTELKRAVSEIIEIEGNTDAETNFFPAIYPNKDLILFVETIFRRNCPTTLLEMDTNGKRSLGGCAISPKDAAQCLRDVIRTSRFVYALKKAIDEKLRQNPGKKVRVLDVGSGPWAALSVMAASQFKPEEVEFSLIDLHPQSLQISRDLINNLGMEDYFMNFICDDACTIVLKDHLSRMPDVCVAEVMNAALMNEPQADVTRNIVSQAGEGCEFIPQKVTVSAILHANNRRNYLGNIIELTKAQVMECLVANVEKKDNGRITGSFRLPDKFDGLGYLFLETELDIYNGRKLKWTESHITSGVKLPDINHGNPGDPISISIKPGGDRFDVKVKIG